MDRDRSDELTGRVPIVPHSTAGGDCGGCIVSVVGVAQIEILRGLLGPLA
jgi:hypothetical protein